jgi:hypothetical protein
MTKILAWRRIKLTLVWSIGVVTLATAAFALIAYKKYVSFPHPSNEVIVYIGVYPDYKKGQVAALKKLSKEIKLHPSTAYFTIMRTSSFYPDIDGGSWYSTLYGRDCHQISDGNEAYGESDLWQDVTDTNINVAARDGTGFKSLERQGCTNGL